jgi:hypothetical protein
VDEDQTRAKFDAFCKEKDLEPTDRDYFFWLSALQTTREQEPVAYGYFGSSGEVLQMLDFIQPDRKPKPVPLYASPMANVPRPDIPIETLRHVWQQYYSKDGDLIGFAIFIQNYMRR